MNRTITKSTASVLLALFAMLPGYHAQAQLPYNFVYSSYRAQSLSVPSIVRAYKPNSAVVYYDGRHSPDLNNKGIIALVKTDGTCCDLPLDDIRIDDMRILNDTLYLCGMEWTNPPNYFIGKIDLTTMVSGNNNNLYYRRILQSIDQDMQMKFVVYSDYLNNTRLVALGTYRYFSHGPNPPAPYPLCPIAPYPPMYTYTLPYEYFPGWTVCQEDFVLECVNPMTATSLDIKLVNSASKNEHMSDIVVTDNYVAFVGNIFNGDVFDTVTIHRCKKDNVLSTFDNYYYFIPPSVEGTIEYSACALDEDNIALVTTAVIDPVIDDFELRVRTVKLSTMTMPTAQRLPVEGKPIQIAQAYLYQVNKTMVHLSDFRFPPGQQYHNYTFVEFLPYKGTAYHTTAFYEKYINKTYESMDVMQDSCLISTGGNYGFIKDIKHEDATSNCYYYEDVYIRLTNTRTIHNIQFSYERNRFPLGPIIPQPYTVDSALRMDPCP
ncbi:MAG: hypothetical protein J6X88_03845 [Bacteroidales bacterium]|nr:hypothetical protein [Bacteroidales bacterium]